MSSTRQPSVDAASSSSSSSLSRRRNDSTIDPPPITIIDQINNNAETSFHDKNDEVEMLMTSKKISKNDDDGSSPSIRARKDQQEPQTKSSSSLFLLSLDSFKYFTAIYIICVLVIPFGYTCYETFFSRSSHIRKEVEDDSNRKEALLKEFSQDFLGDSCSSASTEIVDDDVSGNQTSTPRKLLSLLYSPSSSASSTFPPPLVSTFGFSTNAWNKRCVSECPRRQEMNNNNDPRDILLSKNNASVSSSLIYSRRLSSESNSSSPSVVLNKNPPFYPRHQDILQLQSSTFPISHHCVEESWDGEIILQQSEHKSYNNKYYHLLTTAQWSSKELRNSYRLMFLFCAPVTLILSFIFLYLKRIMLKTVFITSTIISLIAFCGLAYASFSEVSRFSSSSSSSTTTGEIKFIKRFIDLYHNVSISFTVISVFTGLGLCFFLTRCSTLTTGSSTNNTILASSMSSLALTISRVISYMKIAVKIVVTTPSVVMVPIVNSILFTLFVILVLTLWTGLVRNHFEQVVLLQRQPVEESAYLTFDYSSSSLNNSIEENRFLLTAKDFLSSNDDEKLFKTFDTSKNNDNYSLSISSVNDNVGFKIVSKGWPLSKTYTNLVQHSSSSSLLPSDKRVIENVSKDIDGIFNSFVASSLLMLMSVLLVRSALLTLQGMLLAPSSIYWLFELAGEKNNKNKEQININNNMNESSSTSSQVAPGSFFWQEFVSPVICRRQNKEGNESTNSTSSSTKRSLWSSLLFSSFVRCVIDDLTTLLGLWMIIVRRILLEPNSSSIFALLNQRRHFSDDASRRETVNNNNNNSHFSFYYYYLYRFIDIFFVPNSASGFIMTKLLKWSSILDANAVIIGEKIISNSKNNDHDDDFDEETELSFCNQSCDSVEKNILCISLSSSNQSKTNNKQKKTSSSSSSSSIALETLISAEILIRLVSYGLAAGATFVCWFFLDPDVFSTSSSPFLYFFLAKNEQDLTHEVEQQQIFMPLRLAPLAVVFFVTSFVAYSHLSLFAACCKSIVVVYHCLPEYCRGGGIIKSKKNQMKSKRYQVSIINDDDDDDDEGEEGEFDDSSDHHQHHAAVNSVELAALFESVDGKQGVLRMRNYSELVSVAEDETNAADVLVAVPKVVF